MNTVICLAVTGWVAFVGAISFALWINEDWYRCCCEQNEEWSRLCKHIIAEMSEKEEQEWRISTTPITIEEEGDAE